MFWESRRFSRVVETFLGLADLVGISFMRILFVVLFVWFFAGGI